MPFLLRSIYFLLLFQPLLFNKQNIDIFSLFTILLTLKAKNMDKCTQINNNNKKLHLNKQAVIHIKTCTIINRFKQQYNELYHTNKQIYKQ